MSSDIGVDTCYIESRYDMEAILCQDVTAMSKSRITDVFPNFPLGAPTQDSEWCQIEPYQQKRMVVGKSTSLKPLAARKRGKEEALSRAVMY